MGRFTEDGFFDADEDDRDPADEEVLANQDWSGMRDPDSTDDEEPDEGNAKRGG